MVVTLLLDTNQRLGAYNQIGSILGWRCWVQLTALSLKEI